MKVRCLYDKLVPISDLKPHPKNRNKHPKEQIERLAKILDYQGVRYPAKVSNLSGCITSGHGRIEAAKLNGWTEFPVNFQDYDDEAQEYADVQADNAIASWAELDFSGINADLGDLGPELDLEMLGIRSFTVDAAERDIAEINKANETAEWVGLPEFNPGNDYINMILQFKTEEARKLYLEKHGLEVGLVKNKHWIVYMP